MNCTVAAAPVALVSLDKALLISLEFASAASSDLATSQASANVKFFIDSSFFCVAGFRTPPTRRSRRVSSSVSFVPKLQSVASLRRAAKYSAMFSDGS